MVEKLTEIIELHEDNLVKYTLERNRINAQMIFMAEHKFEKEYDYLNTQKNAVNDLFLDYRQIVEQLRDLLNVWNS